MTGMARFPLTLVLVATPALADMPVCNPVTMDCSPVVACVAATGEILRGATFGVDSGVISATSDTGATCTGGWQRTVIGLGLAQFSCTDGRTGASAFTWFEPSSGTAVGSGQMSDGTTVQFWAGNNLARYFREVAPGTEAAMACDPDAMLSS
jgi:hypothetical protein